MTVRQAPGSLTGGHVFKITEMTPADLAFATASAQKEHWAYLESDFRRLIDLEPEGCFVAWEDRSRVGIITTTTYQDYAFVGSLIVKPAKRRRGIGEKLMHRAIGYLEGRSVRAIELDGVFEAASLYRRLGFIDKYLSLRLYRSAAAQRGKPHSKAAGGSSPAGKHASRYLQGRGAGTSRVNPSDLQVLPYRTDDTEKIFRFDRERTGLSRQRVLVRLLADYAASTVAVAGGHIRGYALARPRAGGFFSVGPIVASDVDAAHSLLAAIMSRYAGESLAVGVPDTNQGFVEMLRSAGFKYQAPSLRMFRGERIDYERDIYGIISPEKG
jgi:ribosomal protein S18 acetylase RimI-like enzyme